MAEVRKSMQALHLPPYPFRIRLSTGQEEIFDEVRKKWLVLTPEEWVRQHTVMWLHHGLGFPKGLIGIEQGLRVNGMLRRTDVVGFNPAGTPHLLVECKAPDIPIDQAVFDQAVNYHRTLDVRFIALTNGLRHVICAPTPEGYTFFEDWPAFPAETV